MKTSPAHHTTVTRGSARTVSSSTTHGSASTHNLVNAVTSTAALGSATAPGSACPAMAKPVDNPTRTFFAVSFVLSCLSVGALSNQPSWAAQLLFSPDSTGSGAGSVEIALPLTKLGNVPLPRGRVFIRGDAAQITVVPQWQFDPHVVLNGRVLDTRLELPPGGGERTISGVLLFDSGEWINYYDDKSALESIDTSSGSLVGRISSVNTTDLNLTQLSGQSTVVPLSTVQAIRSPRAFSFRIPLSGIPAAGLTQPAELQAYKVSLAPLGKTFRSTQLKAIVRKEIDDGDISTPKLIALGTALSVANMAQLAPLLAIPLGAESTLKRRAFFQSFLFNQQTLGTSVRP